MPTRPVSGLTLVTVLGACTRWGFVLVFAHASLPSLGGDRRRKWFPECQAFPHPSRVFSEDRNIQPPDVLARLLTAVGVDPRRVPARGRGHLVAAGKNPILGTVACALLQAPKSGAPRSSQSPPLGEEYGHSPEGPRDVADVGFSLAGEGRLLLVSPAS